MKWCCADCFGDRVLRKNIIPLHSKGIGTCSYCESGDVALSAPADLAEYFELLISAYQPDPKGQLLVQWFREDWGMFQHPRLDEARAKDLLAEILNDGQIVRQPFSPSVAVEADRLAAWERLRDELMYRNRFFPDVDIDLERLKLLLVALTLEPHEVPKKWYRARIQINDAPIPVEDMGAPPKTAASHGRANPAGIPYLYLASNEITAISEIRPHTGDIACVCEFETPINLELVDLRSPRKMVSPFLLEDAGAICKMRGDLPFLERLGQELTRPVVPQSAAVAYTPSQYLCEFIKKCDYAGVVYRSSVSEDGINLALFDPDCAKKGSVTQYDVARVSVDVKKRKVP